MSVVPLSQKETLSKKGFAATKRRHSSDLVSQRKSGRLGGFFLLAPAAADRSDALHLASHVPMQGFVVHCTPSLVICLALQTRTRWRFPAPEAKSPERSGRCSAAAS